MKLKFIIKGKKVHDVGYRVFLVNKALSFGVNNFNTFNAFIDGIQAVIAIIEADDPVIEEFKSIVNTSVPQDAEVGSINVEEFKNSVPPIERCMHGFQMEQWGKGIPILLKMLEKQDSMLEKQDSMLEKQDSMLEKQDSMLEKQDSMLEKQDSMLEKQDSMLELQKEIIVTIKTEGKQTRDVISTRISQDVLELRREIDHVKTTLAKVVEKVGISET